jgi:hypothetical protein
MEIATKLWHTTLWYFWTKARYTANQNAPPQDVQKPPHRPPSHRTSTKLSGGRGAVGANSCRDAAENGKKGAWARRSRWDALRESRMICDQEYFCGHLWLPQGGESWLKQGFHSGTYCYSTSHKKSIDDKWMKSPPKAKCFELLKCLQSQKRLGRSSLQCDQIILIIYCDVSHRQKTIGGYDHKIIGSNATSDIPKGFWLGERLVIGWDFKETCYWNIPIQQPQGTLCISPPPYLSSRHWSKEAGSGPLRFQNKIGEPLNCDSCPFTVEGLDVVPRNCKKSSRGQTVYLWKCLHGFTEIIVCLYFLLWTNGGRKERFRKKLFMPEWCLFLKRVT